MKEQRTSGTIREESSASSGDKPFRHYLLCSIPRPTGSSADFNGIPEGGVEMSQTRDF
jgi:hypothetical protein